MSASITVSMNELKFAVRWAALGKQVPPGLADELANAATTLAALQPDPLGPLLSALEALPVDYSWGKLELLSRGNTLQIGSDVSPIETGPVVSDVIKLNTPVTFATPPTNAELLLGYLAPLKPTSELVPWMPEPLLNIATSTRNAHGTDVAESDWQRLWRLTNQALAPATETSRLTGAGAGLNDRD